MIATKPLSEVAEVFNGKTPAKAEKRNSGYPILKIGDITENEIFCGKFESFVDESFSERFKNKRIALGDTLILNAAHNADYVGSKQYFVEESVEGAIATGEWLIVRGNQKETDKSYLNYWLRTIETKHKLKKLVKGIHLYPRDVENLAIPLPPLDEQKRIAAILDKADNLRRKRQQAIDLADQFLRSVFLDMFGDPMKNPKNWKTDKLDSLINRGPNNGLYKPGNYYGEGTRILRIDGFYDGYLEDQSKLKRLKVEEKETIKYKLTNRSIVINRVNSREYLGKCALVEGLNETTLFESNMMNFSVDESSINSRYLVDFLASPFGKRQILARCKDAVNQSSINQQDVKSFKIRVPPIDLQNKYENIVHSVIKNVTKQESMNEEAATMFRSLSFKAFSGSL